MEIVPMISIGDDSGETESKPRHNTLFKPAVAFDPLWPDQILTREISRFPRGLFAGIFATDGDFSDRKFAGNEIRAGFSRVMPDLSDFWIIQTWTLIGDT